ncbi:MAG TPA: class I SAM-dependent methyltransferase [Candidatus Binatia bacterium]|nr:class I SAM-dependent methyltransferase [Candidatus Binatia bacterium]
MQPKEKNTHVKHHWIQFRCPTGVLGRKVAANMNKEHWDLTTWGLKHVRTKSDSLVLDVGCGGGKTIGRLARRAVHGKVYGIDHSADMVDYSRQVNKKLIAANRVEILQGTAEKTGFKNDFFDLVTAIETYYFWPNLAESFQEIKRVLKKGGYLLIISEMVKDGAYEVENAEVIAKTLVCLVSLQEIQRILHSVGYSDVKAYRKRKSNWNAILAQKS